MNLTDAKRYYKTVTKNLHTITSIPAEKFVEFAECLLREIEKSKEEQK